MQNSDDTTTMSLSQKINDLNTAGNRLTQQNKINEALQSFLEVLKIDPRNSFAYNNIGAIHMNMGDYSKAMKFFEESIKCDYTNIRAYTNIGLLHTQLNNFDLALKYLSEAANLQPSNMNIQKQLNDLLKKAVPLWHFRMMNDSVRNKAYQRAIKNKVKKGDIVLDIGTGSGLLAMMSAKAGAGHVYACEMNPLVANVAREIIKQNNFENKITVINKMSTSLVVGVDIPAKADVLTSEIICTSFLTEGVIPTVVDAKNRLLKEDAEIIPQKGILYACLLESEELHDLTHVDKICGFDLSPFNKLCGYNELEITLRETSYTELSDTFETFNFDFTKENFNNAPKQIQVDIKKSGTCHTFGQWFKLFVDEENVVDVHPSCSLTNWRQTIHPLEKVVKVKKGQKVQVNASHDDLHTFLSLDKDINY